MSHERKRLSRYSAYLILFFIPFIWSCGEEENEPAPKFNVLHEKTQLFERTLAENQRLVEFSGLTSLQEYLEYDIRVFEITYKTDYLGTEIIASGLVAFPITEEPMPMLSFQHGTIVKHSDAPTEDKVTYHYVASVASAGYIFLLPDFIGFGSSSQILHPYYHADLTAGAVTDMMLAVKELAEVEGFKFNGKAFLAGYSEGGFATMATHRAIETEGLDGVEVVASAPASGAYDVKGMQEFFFSNATYSNPFYIAYVALAYESTYGWNQPLSDFFNEPYATNIPDYFDGSISGDSIDKLLTHEIAALLNPDFYMNLDTDPTYSKMVAALEENSVTDWVPQSKVYMYHGSADKTVPYQNSLDTYHKMIQAGASPDNVKLFRLEGADHGTGFLSYLKHVVPLFEELK